MNVGSLGVFEIHRTDLDVTKTIKLGEAKINLNEIRV